MQPLVSELPATELYLATAHFQSVNTKSTSFCEDGSWVLVHVALFYRHPQPSRVSSTCSTAALTPVFSSFRGDFTHLSFSNSHASSTKKTRDPLSCFSASTQARGLEAPPLPLPLSIRVEFSNFSCPSTHSSTQRALASVKSRQRDTARTDAARCLIKCRYVEA